MSWIEGVGDEVTITFTLFIGLIVLLLAWYSTGIRDIPFISVIIVQFTRRRVRAPDADQTPASGAVSGESQNEAQVDGSSGGIQAGSVNASAAETGGDVDSINVENIKSQEESKKEETTNEATKSISKAEEKNHSNDCNEEIKITKVNPTEAGLPQPKDKSESTVNDESDIINNDGNPLNDTEVTSLSEQEIRQKRLEFFIRGSQNIVDSQRIESQLENSESENSENAPSQVKDSAASVQNVASSDNEPQTGSSVDPSRESRSDQTNNQSCSVGQSSVDEIRVRIKFLNDEQRLVTCSPTETIGNFRRQHFSTELSESKLVRFIFNGQDLRNDASTLQSYNIMDNSVLHCLVTQPRQNEQPNVHDDDGLDMGTFMFPLFGVLLGIVWYMRFMYRQFFNVTSTLTLGGITFLYLAAFLSSFRRQRHEHLD